jgi:hypothetical protein
MCILLSCQNRLKHFRLRLRNNCVNIDIRYSFGEDKTKKKADVERLFVNKASYITLIDPALQHNMLLNFHTLQLFTEAFPDLCSLELLVSYLRPEASLSFLAHDLETFCIVGHEQANSPLFQCIVLIL